MRKSVDLAFIQDFEALETLSSFQYPQKEKTEASMTLPFQIAATATWGGPKSLPLTPTLAEETEAQRRLCARASLGPAGMSKEVCHSSWETQVRSLSGEDPLEKESSPTPVFCIEKSHWTEEPGGLAVGRLEVRTQAE